MGLLFIIITIVLMVKKKWDAAKIFNWIMTAVCFIAVAIVYGAASSPDYYYNDTTSEAMARAESAGDSIVMGIISGIVYLIFAIVCTVQASKSKTK